MNRDEQLQAVLEDLRRKQGRWASRALELVSHPNFEMWWSAESRADAYQDAADQIEKVLESCQGCGRADCTGVCQNEE